MSALEEVRHLLSEAAHVPAEQIDATTSIATFPAWDSVAHVYVMLALEEKLGRPLLPMEVASIDSVAAIVALIEAGAARRT